MIVWVILGLLILFLLIFVVALSLKKDKKLPPTDYYNLFIMGIIFSGAGVAIWTTTKMPVLFILGLVLMAAGMTHQKEWDKNRRANEWKNLTKDQRKMKLTLIWSMLGVLILGLIAFGIIYLISGM